MSSSDKFDYGIAVIGMACRFPKARNVDEFWRNLREGVEAISFFSEEELRAAGVEAEELSDPNYVRADAYLEDVDIFDASFFGFSPREAAMMDPQHRIFLEQSWKACEMAGYIPETYEGRIGVYAGAGRNSYLLTNLLSNPQLIESAGNFQTTLGNDGDYLATRVSYKLNLKGPSINVQTACSTSLVAIHLACQSLLNRECDMALAGGASIRLPQKHGYMYQDGGILSPDGHCRAFDARAQGTVGGSGVGVVLLKRLADAVADNDTIHAIIIGSAVNNDGSLKVGFTAPSVEGQASVIEEALAMAMVEPETITYVEAHGTGTALGDPIEIAALTQAFRTGTQKRGFCALGSVKTNLGHLDAAAGIAGFIKTLMAIKHKMLPPSLHFQEPNPKIDFEDSPFCVNNALRQWEVNKGPRRAAISSFGIGGTNAHIIIEEAPEARTETTLKPYHLLVLSAKTDSALDGASARLASFLKQNSETNLADVAHTLQVGRKGFEHRRALVCRDAIDAFTALETLDPARVLTHFGEQKSRPVAFVFSGQGAQYVNMCAELYNCEPIFRSQLDHCFQILKSRAGLNLREVIYPDSEREEWARERLDQTVITQPALFAIEYALAKLLMEWGVRPQAMIGHSIGEYVAACLAGVFSLEDALALVAARGQLMQQLPAGCMLAVTLSEDDLQPLLEQSGELSLAAINAPSLCVASGPARAIERLEDRLRERAISCHRLRTSHAFHSQMMEPILSVFAEKLRRVKLGPPAIPYISNLTGTWIKESEAISAEYWLDHLRRTVRFASGIDELLKDPDRILLEVGPGQTLRSFMKQEGGGDRVALSFMRHPRDRQHDFSYLLTALARLWLEGAQINWPALYSGEVRRRVALPTYPFERQRHWVEPRQGANDHDSHNDDLNKRPNLADWFHLPSWKRSVLAEVADEAEEIEQESCWVVMSDALGLGDEIINRLKNRGHDCIMAKAGERFAQLDGGTYTLNPRKRDDYVALLKEIRTLGKQPHAIIHLWNVTSDYLAAPAGGHHLMDEERFEESQYFSFYSLLFLAQALGEEFPNDRIEVLVVSDKLQDVTGEESLNPEKATLLGPCKVIPLEYPNLTCRSIDIMMPISISAAGETLIDQLISEFNAKSANSVVAYRGNYRWAQVFEPVRMNAKATRPARLREGGVYLLTGGLQEIDLALAEHLARAVRAKLILTGDADLPEKEEWEAWLRTHDDQNQMADRMNRIIALESSGAEALVIKANVADRKQLSAVVRRAIERFGAINGVIHTAAITAGGMVQLKTPEMAASVFGPKVKGTLALVDLLQDMPLDFIVLFSSTLSITGAFGQVDYAAANAFLDSFARYNVRENGTFTISVDWHISQWEDWQEAAIAVPELQAQLKETRQRYGVSVDDGLEAFDRILSRPYSQVIVATQDFQAVLEQQEATSKSGLLKMLEGGSPFDSASLRSRLDGEFIAPRNEIEQAAAKIWEELFGIERLGIHDNFFNLGGNSLLAIQLVSQMRKAFDVDLPLSKLFESPTIAEISTEIAEMQNRARQIVEMEQMLREIEELSLEEVQAQLRQSEAASEET